MVVDRGEAVGRLADDDVPVRAGDLARGLQHRLALVEREVLEHRVEQEDVDLAGVLTDPVENPLGVCLYELDVLQAPSRQVLACVGEAVGVDVDPNVTRGPRGQRAGDRALAAGRRLPQRSRGAQRDTVTLFRDFWLEPIYLRLAEFVKAAPAKFVVI